MAVEVYSLQISHVFAGSSPVTVSGYKARLSLDEILPVFGNSFSPDISNLYINDSGASKDSYCSIVIAVDPRNMDEILSRLTNATVTLVLTLVIEEFGEVDAYVFSLNLSYFRYDLGPKNSSMTLVSTTQINRQIRSTYTVIDFSGKTKRDENGTDVFGYYINPLDHSQVSVGTDLIDGAFNGVITKNILTMTATDLKLFVEAK